MSKPSIKYDKVSDTLRVCFNPGLPATGIELSDHILLRINQQQRRAVSIVFFEYSVLALPTEIGTRSFPISGLSWLSNDIQEMVFDILLTPPVSEFLQLFSYTVSLAETIPIISLQPIPVEIGQVST